MPEQYLGTLIRSIATPTAEAAAAAGGCAPKCLMLKKEDEEAFQLMWSQCLMFARGGSSEGTSRAQI